jgi:S1-C subfamily serine protease
MAELIGKHKIGDTVKVEYWRNKEIKTVDVVLKEAK